MGLQSAYQTPNRTLTMRALGIVLVSSVLINSCLTQDSGEDETRPQDVFDTIAWAAIWVNAIGLYAGRQEAPWRRGPPGVGVPDDLPNIYIPNELTANEIVRAMKITGKNQMVIEENQLLDFLDFHFKESAEKSTPP